MANRILNHVRLGLFVISGLILLIVLLYFIGKNGNLFSPSFSLKALFKDIQGLQQGNNVRFSGIQAGAVKKIVIRNDTTIEVTLSMDKTFKNIIRKNAEVSIGTDGFVGNKIVNITPSKIQDSFVAEEDILPSKKSFGTDEMLNTLSETNRNIAVLSYDLKNIVHSLVVNKDLMRLIQSNEIPLSVRSTLDHLNRTAVQLQHTSGTINTVLDSVLLGRGSVASLLRDTFIYRNIIASTAEIEKFSKGINGLAEQADQLISFLSESIKTGNFQTLMADTSILNSMKRTLINVEQGTYKFDQDMEALKSNFLFRGYFRKLEKNASKK